MTSAPGTGRARRSPSAEELKVRRQKIFIAVGGLLLLGIAGFELPGLVSSGSAPRQASAATVAARPAQPAAGIAAPVVVLPHSIADTRARDLFAPQVTTAPQASGGTPASTTKSGPAVRTKDFVVKDVFVPQVAPPAASTVPSTVVETPHGSSSPSPTQAGGGYIVVLGLIPGIGSPSQNAAAHAVVAARNAGLKNVVANDAVPGQSGSGPHFTIYTGPWSAAGTAQSELVRALRNGYPHAHAQQLPSSSGKGF